MSVNSTYITVVETVVTLLIYTIITAKYETLPKNIVD